MAVALVSRAAAADDGGQDTQCAGPRLHQPRRAPLEREQLPREQRAGQPRVHRSRHQLHQAARRSPERRHRQLFSRDLGPDSNYNAQFDWLYLDYHWQDGSGCAPAASSSRTACTTTRAISTRRSRSCCCRNRYIPRRTAGIPLAQTGLELYGYRPLGRSRRARLSRAYFGTLNLAAAERHRERRSRHDPRSRTSAAGALQWETPVDGPARHGASALPRGRDRRRRTRRRDDAA